MKFLQIGLGSMGKRRIKCLIANGQKEIVGFDLSEKRRKEAEDKFKIDTFESFEDALAVNPDAVIISVPGYLHMQYLLKCVKAGKHTFVEVPLSISLDGINELKKKIVEKNLICAPGCQLLFHPPTQTLKDWVSAKDFGKLLNVSYTMGTYLPDWHPYEDITSFYASDMNKGGGNIDVMAQELVWLNWIINSKIKEVTCRMGKIGNLPLAEGTPDHIEMIVEYENSLMLNLHFDINDRTHESYIRFAGENKTAVWSKTAFKSLVLYNSDDKKWTKYRPPKNYNFELSYIEEIAEWINCIKKGKSWPVSIDTAENIVKVLRAFKISNNERRPVNLEEIQ